MARRRSPSIEFKRQVAQDFLADETLHELSKRHDVSPYRIRLWMVPLRGARRRGAFTVNDLAQAHEGGMDSFARGLKDVRRLIDDGEIESIDRERRASCESGVAKSISDGDEDFSSLEP